MSLDLQVYTKQLSDNLIPQIIKRLNEYDMVVEIHPDFSFSNQTGFLPFKFQLTNPNFEILKGKELISGFELYIEDFDLNAQKEILKPKQSFLDRLLGKKQTDVSFASPQIESRLKDCKKVVTFVWHAGDSFELRFASLTSAILTEITNGVCCYPADDIWYDTENIVDNAYKEFKQYEESIREQDLNFHEFDGWN